MKKTLWRLLNHFFNGGPPSGCAPVTNLPGQPGFIHGLYTRPPVAVASLLLIIAATGVLFSGCARFKTTQTDTSYDKGQPLRKITTRATTTTFFDSKSSLAQFKATQTDKTQTASVGSLSQEASGTNAVDLVSKVTSAIVGAAIKAAVPTP